MGERFAVIRTTFNSANKTKNKIKHGALIFFWKQCGRSSPICGMRMAPLYKSLRPPELTLLTCETDGVKTTTLLEISGQNFQDKTNLKCSFRYLNKKNDVCSTAHQDTQIMLDTIN